MARSLRTRALVLALWTVFLWVTRIRNAANDDTSTAAGKAIAVTTAVVFTVGALGAGFAVLARRGWAQHAVAALAGVTIVYWPVRVVQIALHGHPAGFVAVHAVLGALSVALAARAWPLRRPVLRRAGLLPGR